MGGFDSPSRTIVIKLRPPPFFPKKIILSAIFTAIKSLNRFTTLSIMAIFNLNINGKKQQVDLDPATPMLWVLRDHLNLVGTKYGCGVAQCGACTIHLGDVAMRSCQLPVSQVGNQAITTIEGLSENGDHPVQKAWLEHDVAQCGYCQAGQIMNASALLKANPHPSDAEIEGAMNGNICRCATYVRIKAAIKTAAG
jgi:isoquinoline 1-oxidoreductase subunit alpha